MVFVIAREGLIKHYTLKPWRFMLMTGLGCLGIDRPMAFRLSKTYLLTYVPHELILLVSFP